MKSNNEDPPDLSANGWQMRYDNDQTGWDRGEPSPQLFDWLDSGELTQCRIMVPGCGRGHEVIELARRGFEVTALDFAKRPVQELTRRLTDENLVADVLCESVLHYATEIPFDAVYEQTCLCALAPNHWPAYERMLFNSLRDGGRVFALFMQSEKNNGPPYSCEVDEMRNLFQDDRWVWPELNGESIPPKKVEHPSGMFEIAVVLTKGNQTRDA